jgi:hypothetical protein
MTCPGQVPVVREEVDSHAPQLLRPNFASQMHRHLHQSHIEGGMARQLVALLQHQHEGFEGLHKLPEDYDPIESRQERQRGALYPQREKSSAGPILVADVANIALSPILLPEDLGYIPTDLE